MTSETTPPDIDTENLRQTAYHEAGHAVVQIALRRYGGDEFEAVHIFPENHRPGVPLTPFIDGKDREVFALGIVEGPSIWNAKWQQGMRVKDMLAVCAPESERATSKAFWLESMRREIMVLMAGPYAQLGYLNLISNKSDALYNVLFNFKRGDIVQAEAVMVDYRSVTGRNPLRKLMNASLDLVRVNWTAIDTLAQALLEKHSLTYDEAFVAITPHLADAA